MGNDKKIRIGMIGCGGIAMTHLRSLQLIDNVEVVALATRNQSRIKDARMIVPNAKAYDTGEAMIAAEEVDVAFISVTPSRHGDLERLCAEKGIHMYIEKPLEVDYVRAAQIDKAITDSGVLCSVGYQERYFPAFDKALAFLKHKNIRMVEGRWMGHMVGAAWWREKAQSGGQIIEQSTHIYDLIRYLAGEGKVTAAVATKAPAPGALQNDVEGASVALLQMDNGAIGQVTTACFMDSSIPAEIITRIWCDDGRVEYDWTEKKLTLIEAGHCEVYKEPAGQHTLAVHKFIEAVQYGDKSKILCDYSDALKSFKLTIDAQNFIEGR